MATLRQAIRARIESLAQQIEDIKKKAAGTIAPLQKSIQDEEAKLVRFTPWLDQEVTTAQTKLNTLLDSYK